jgi:4a-hydroxytetrahydrobiopterin dehydratase
MKNIKKLSIDEIKKCLSSVKDWTFENGVIQKSFVFKNYDETTAFVNDVIEIAQTHDHHPQISFGYKDCRVEYATHSIGGISDKDFTCAHKINQLV